MQDGGIVGCRRALVKIRRALRRTLLTQMTAVYAQQPARRALPYSCVHSRFSMCERYESEDAMRSTDYRSRETSQQTT